MIFTLYFAMSTVAPSDGEKWQNSKLSILSNYKKNQTLNRLHKHFKLQYTSRGENLIEIRSKIIVFSRV
jgi:hypothetical protein